MELKYRYTRVQFALVFGALYIVWATIVTSQAWNFDTTHPHVRLAITTIFIALTIRATQLRLRDAVYGAKLRQGMALIVVAVVVAY